MIWLGFSHARIKLSLKFIKTGSIRIKFSKNTDPRIDHFG